MGIAKIFIMGPSFFLKSSCLLLSLYFPSKVQFISLMGKECCKKQFHEMYCLQHWSYKQLFCFSMFSVLLTVGASWAYLIPLATIIFIKSLELTEWSSYISFLKADIYDESAKLQIIQNFVIDAITRTLRQNSDICLQIYIVICLAEN